MAAVEGARAALHAYLAELGESGRDIDRQRYNASESMLFALDSTDPESAHRHLAHAREVLRGVICFYPEPVRYGGWIMRRLCVVRDLLDTSGRHARNVAFAEACLADPTRLPGNNVGQLFIALMRECRGADIVALVNLCSGMRIPVEPCTIQRMTDYYELCFSRVDEIRPVLVHVGMAARAETLLQSWRSAAGELPERVVNKLCGSGSDYADGLATELAGRDLTDDLNPLFMSSAFATLDVCDSIVIEQHGLQRNGMQFLPSAVQAMFLLRHTEQAAAGHV